MAAFDVDLAEATHKAYDELQALRNRDIQRTTAITWAGRALAAYQLYMTTAQPYFRLDAGDYAHEALEHAALAGPETYMEVHASLRALESGIP